MPRTRAALALLLLVPFAGLGCAPADGREATSLLGDALHAMPMDTTTRVEREAQLAEARARFEDRPTDADALIWYGRRLAYLGRYRAAIDVFSRGLRAHPDDYRLLRHRGHRHLTTRRFIRAIADLERAAQLIDGVPDAVEPDGMPNALGIPTSTSHTNIHYHLGLAHYLRGSFDQAAASYRLCMVFAKNDDMKCATAYWLHLALRRAGHDAEAAIVLDDIHRQMDVIENHAYHRLLLLYRGDLPRSAFVSITPDGEAEAIEDATTAYGLAMWHRFRGEGPRAHEMLKSIVTGTAWPAFGHIAAEADLAR